jgi:hypothetical protein
MCSGFEGKFYCDPGYKGQHVERIISDGEGERKKGNLGC